MDFGFVDPVLAEIGNSIAAVVYVGTGVLTVLAVIKVHRWVRRSV